MVDVDGGAGGDTSAAKAWVGCRGMLGSRGMLPLPDVIRALSRNPCQVRIFVLSAIVVRCPVRMSWCKILSE